MVGRVRADGVAVGIAGSRAGSGVGGVASGNAADDGEGFSPRNFAGTGGEFAGRADDGSDCAAGIFDTGERNGLGTGGAFVGPAVGLAGGAAGALSAMVRGDGARELPDSGAAVVVDGGVFVCGVILAAFLRFENTKWRWLWWSAIGGGLTAAAVIAMYPFPARVVRGDLEVDVLDVGQGGFDSGDFAEREHSAD